MNKELEKDHMKGGSQAFCTSKKREREEGGQ